MFVGGSVTRINEGNASWQPIKNCQTVERMLADWRPDSRAAAVGAKPTDGLSWPMLLKNLMVERGRRR